MAEKLFKLRTQFVNRVSEEILNQLLDDLEDTNILNFGEVQAITQGSTTTTHRARQLISSVRGKGDKASNKFIHYFQNRDRTLYEALCKECGLTATPVAQETLQTPKEEQGSMVQHDGPSTFIKITKNFCSEREIYPVTSISMMNRVALLINNINFEHWAVRKGAEIDEENMENLLTSLGYEVVKHRDLTAHQMDEAIIEFSKHRKLTKTDSVFVVIMSQGQLGDVFGVDAEALPVDNIHKHLDAENCPALVDKPKIIIIQACRGHQFGSVITRRKMESNDLTGGSSLQTQWPPTTSDSACSVPLQSQPPPTKPDSSCKVSLQLESQSPEFAQSNIKENALSFAHREKDFISLLSSTPHTVSYRHTSKGSFLIQILIKVFNKFGRNDDIEELFRKVMRQFEKAEDFPDRIKQMPTKDRCTLTRLFYFFPGL